MSTHPAATNSDAELPDASGRFARALLAVSMLVMGACGIIYEYALGVMGNNLLGSSREELFVVIGVMMFAMGVGSIVQQRCRRNLIEWFLGIELLLGLLGGASILVIYTAFVYTDSYRLVLYGFAFLIGMLIGCEIPLLIRINRSYTRTLRGNLSAILSMDYVGSLLGALLFAYVLLTRLSLDRISLILGCTNASLAVAGLLFFWKAVRGRVALAASCAGVMALLCVALWRGENWMAALEQRCFPDPIIHSETSPYQHVVLTKKRDRLRLYIDGHLQFSSDDEAIYHELLVYPPMLLAKDRRRVLILGGGDGLALREVLRFPEVRQVTLVDIDPAIIKLASEHPDVIRVNQAAFNDSRVHAQIGEGTSPGRRVAITRPTKRQPFVDETEYKLAEVRVVTVDADQFVRGVTGQFDVVIIDFPDPRTIELAKLYSVEFYRALSARLSPGAALAVQSGNPLRARQAFGCINKTLAAAGFRTLPYHEHVPSFGEWGWHLAWRTEMSGAKALARLRQAGPLPPAARYVTPQVMSAAFVFGKDVLINPGRVAPSTKLRPVILQYYDQGLRR